MNVSDLVLIAGSLLTIVAFSVLAARAEESLWSKCSRKESCRRIQERITMGKSHLR